MTSWSTHTQTNTTCFTPPTSDIMVYTHVNKHHVLRPAEWRHSLYTRKQIPRAAAHQIVTSRFTHVIKPLAASHQRMTLWSIHVNKHHVLLPTDWRHSPRVEMPSAHVTLWRYKIINWQNMYLALLWRDGNAPTCCQETDSISEKTVLF